MARKPGLGSASASNPATDEASTYARTIENFSELPERPLAFVVVVARTADCVKTSNPHGPPK